MSEEKELGKIESTKLGFEHGVLTFSIVLNFGSLRQGYGGYTLDNDKCHEVITGILRVANVDSWEKLKGKYVFAIRNPKVSSYIQSLEPAIPSEGSPFKLRDIYPEEKEKVK